MFSILSIPERKGSAASAVFGIAGVVAVLVGVLSIGQGFKKAMVSTGSPENAIILRGGADAEMMSLLGKDDVRIIADAPGIARGLNGPLSSAELFVIIDLSKRSTGTSANVPLRGVEEAAFEVHREVQIVEGRRFENGKNELIVGRGAAMSFKGLEVGNQLQIGLNQWTVVGQFTAEGGVSESELWTGTPVLQQAYRRGTSYQSVLARLESGAAFDRFKAWLAADPRLNVKVVRQTDYYAEQSQLIYNLITVLGSLIASLMAIGATFGAINTMYTMVASRTREIATLRALGFGAGPVLFSIVIESLILALLGGIIGATLAYLAFNGYRTSTINFQSFSQVAFAFSVTPGLLVQGVIYATAIGLIGGFFPAIRAIRLPVAAALRET